MMMWWQIQRHIWKLGHSIEVRKYITTLATDSGAYGWLYVCDCGETWAR